jgi:hypothetical protein
MTSFRVLFFNLPSLIKTEEQLQLHTLRMRTKQLLPHLEYAWSSIWRCHDVTGTAGKCAKLKISQ